MKRLLPVFYGIIYGISNVIPGVSGGTMMVVFGCYETVCTAFALDIKFIKKNLAFLIPFGVGAAGGILGFSFAASYLIGKHPVPTFMFFIGLILGSLPVIFKNLLSRGGLKPYHFIWTILALSLIFAMDAANQNEEDGFTLTKSKTSQSSDIIAVKLTNTTNQTVKDWVVEFPEGSVTAAGHAELFRRSDIFEQIRGAFTGEQSSVTNAFKSIPENREIKPGASVAFTYQAKDGERLELEASMTYKMNYSFFLKLMICGFIAAVAMIVPGVSGSFMLMLFGVYSTIIGAVSKLDLLILLPAAAGIFAGIIFGARAIKSLLSRYHTGVYSIITGLMLGSVFVIFPEEIHFDLSLAVGGAMLITGAAISAAVGMERKSKDDLKKTGENLK